MRLPFVVAVNIAGTEGVVSLPAIPVLKRVETQLVKSPTISAASWGRGDQGHALDEKQACFSAQTAAEQNKAAGNDWIFNPDSAEIFANRQGAAGPPSLKADIYVRDEPRVCWGVYAHTGDRRVKVAIEAGVNVIRRRTLPD